VLEDVDLDLFDACVVKTFANRDNYRKAKNVPFYESMNLPIVLS
jgi:hypothetical protein